MISRLDPIDQRLLDEFQRDFPLVSQPFVEIGKTLELSEADVLDRLKALLSAGRIARVGGTVRPNTAGASTLAAMSIPEERLSEVAARVGCETGVNHSYLRENAWNLWFVATAPNVAKLENSLDAIRTDTGLEVLDLRLRRPFNIDLGFRLSGARKTTPRRGEADMSVFLESDRPLLHAMSQGLPLVERPYEALGNQLGRSETDIISRLDILYRAGLLTRIGVIVRHRSVGWSSNAMVVWKVPQDRMIAAGEALAQHPGVTLCYERVTVPGVWDYSLYSMIHARSRSEAQDILKSAAALPELLGIEHQPLFSVRCFKQTGAVLQDRRERAA
ncbi:AsnC family transcriptional regulator [uncultured Pelagimonas sp.]|uniref:siroheme decarboxylase subunit beta n=1 Tax=uncultured Pelagimonas sp. TaxID=1618102 RepID=UPI002630F9AC|nr:AsnC family transcriptional regulator [uncultured Pelagimonas sp.]